MDGCVSVYVWHKRTNEQKKNSSIGINRYVFNMTQNQKWNFIAKNVSTKKIAVFLSRINQIEQKKNENLSIDENIEKFECT